MAPSAFFGGGETPSNAPPVRRQDCSAVWEQHVPTPTLQTLLLVLPHAEPLCVASLHLSILGVSRFAAGRGAAAASDNEEASLFEGNVLAHAKGNKSVTAGNETQPARNHK